MEPIMPAEDEKKIPSNIEENEWKSCCFKADKDFLKFFVQVAISFMILSLSIYKLCIITGNSEDKSLYVSLLTLILGIYTPQPTIKNTRI
jgi:hypothetical protein